MTELVRQEDSFGCMIAACAMVLGRSYGDTKSLLHPWLMDRQERSGIGQGEMDGLLAEHGYATARRFEHYHVACCHRPNWPPAPWADIHICEVQTSMPHAVVMLNDGRILDPYYGERASLREYVRTFWVASVHKIRSELPEFIGPTTTGRKRPTVCVCSSAWDAK